MPVYNAERYIKDCLDSLLDQGMDYSDYEIICVNDGSKDNSLRILEEYNALYPNIVIINQKNSGVSVTRNTGIRYATGKYIAFVDSDDLVFPKAYGRLINLAEELNAQIVQFGSQRCKPEDTLETIGEVNSFNDKAFAPVACDGLAHTTVWKQLTLLKVIKDNNLWFSPEVEMGEDMWFSEQLMCFIETGAAYSVPDVFYIYRYHLQSSSQNNLPSTTKKKKDSMIKIAELSRDFISSTQLRDIDYTRIINRRYEAVSSALIYALQLGGKCTLETKKILKEKELYPYKLTKWFFVKKRSLTKWLNMLCRYSIGVNIIAIVISAKNYIRNKYKN